MHKNFYLYTKEVAMIKRFWQCIKTKIFGRIDYKDSYNAISEAKYLETQINHTCYKPKYRKLKNFIVSLTIYLLFMSMAYNILLIRELDNTREHLLSILNELHEINADEKILQSIEAISKRGKK